MDSPPLFLNRQEAGELLGKRLQKYARKNPLILGLPRGGMAVAYEVATVLGAPLDALVVRKIGLPDNPELAIGAIGENGTVEMDEKMIEGLGISVEQIDNVLLDEAAELQRRLDMYRQGRGLPDLSAHTAIVVDDGLATGLTGKVAIRVAKSLNAKKIVLAVPICADQSLHHFAESVDEVICLENISDLGAIGNYYADFSVVTDDEVLGYLKSSRSDDYVSTGDLDSAEVNIGSMDETMDPDTTDPETVGEQLVGGSATDPAADDDVERMARIAGIKTKKVHR
jgi:putative phosphoribosyl transferase